MTAAADPSAWGEFGVALVGASAALVGLIFVAISINLREILAVAGLAARAAEALLTLFAALLATALLLVPDQGLTPLGLEWATIGVALGFILVTTHRRAVRIGGLERRVLVVRVVTHESMALLFVIAGLATVAGTLGGLYWIAPAALWAIAVGILDGWVLLVEILR